MKEAAVLEVARVGRGEGLGHREGLATARALSNQRARHRASQTNDELPIDLSACD
jgi:hypothetical protein